MAKNKTPARAFHEVLTWLRSHGFEVRDQQGHTHIQKNGCAAVIGADDAGLTRIVTRPGVIVAGEIASLMDKGYQKVLKCSKMEVAATAAHLRALHEFAEELREATGATSLYNEALGTVSDRYVYDRVVGRDDAAPKRRPWETVKK